MASNAHEAYMESRILSASPVELVRVLYQSALTAVNDARKHLAAGEIKPRSEAIFRASTMVCELSCSLDLENGGEVGRSLAQLYEYIGRRLLEANFEQKDEPLAEVVCLLTTLMEAWKAVGSPTESPAAAVSVEPDERSASPWHAGIPAGATPCTAPQGWSF